MQQCITINKGSEPQINLSKVKKTVGSLCSSAYGDSVNTLAILLAWSQQTLCIDLGGHDESSSKGNAPIPAETNGKKLGISGALMNEVEWRFGHGSLRCDVALFSAESAVRSFRDFARRTNLAHSSIYDKVLPNDKRALVTSQEDDGLRLFNGFSKAAGWEMDRPTLTFDFIVAEPVLKERSAIAYVSVATPNVAEKASYFRGAGQSALNLKPSLAWTMASSRVMASTAPLLAVYASCGAPLPTRATTLAVLMILVFVFLCLRMLSTACLLPYQTPLTLMLWVRSQILSGVLTASSSSACIIPALLNMTSTPPQEST